MHFLRYLSKSSCQTHQHHHLPYRRTIHDETSVSSFKWVRDRGLDHAVEKEGNLRPLLNLKNIIKSEPSKSLPLAIIAENKYSLGLPFRPIDFIRKYPSVFQEFLPGGIGIQPHIKLTEEVLSLDVEEQLIYQSEIHKQEVADRLLKLLMIARINKIPLQIIDRLKWDLGLPQDYTQSIVPEFPDYFQVNTIGKEPFLELVCWSNELAVSVLEKKGMPITFPLQYSRGFHMDKKFMKWVDEWQKLPYISPYANALHLQPKGDESDKWAIGLLHEFLHLLVPKKTERDNILCLGEYMGVRSRFKRALLQHPGIFYVSSKIGTHTSILREAYKRDLLIGKQHPLMGLRSKYIHVMNMVKEGSKSRSVGGDGARTRKAKCDSKGEMEDNESGEEDENSFDSSDSEFEDCGEDEYHQEEIEAKVFIKRGRTNGNVKFEQKSPLSTLQNMPAKRGTKKLSDDDMKNDEIEKAMIRGLATRKSNIDEKIPKRIMQNSSSRRNRRNLREEDNHDEVEVKNESAISGGRTSRKAKSDENIHFGVDKRLAERKGMKEKNPPRSATRIQMLSRQNARGRSPGGSDIPRTREGHI